MKKSATKVFFFFFFSLQICDIEKIGSIFQNKLQKITWIYAQKLNLIQNFPNFFSWKNDKIYPPTPPKKSLGPTN